MTIKMKKNGLAITFAGFALILAGVLAGLVGCQNPVTGIKIGTQTTGVDTGPTAGSGKTLSIMSDFITVAGGYTGPAQISYYNPVAVVLDGAEPQTTGTLDVTIRSDGKVVYDPSLTVPAGGLKSLTLTHPDLPPDGKVHLIGRSSPSSVSPVVLKLEIDGELVFRPVGNHSGVPIGSYAEFQLINTVSGALAGEYEQEAELDLMGVSWSGIGAAAPFTGKYSGKNITNLYYNSPNGSGGLFSHLSGSNSEVKGLSILSGSVTGGDNVGSIAGLNEGANIIDCFNAVDVSGGENVGGLVGRNTGSIITITITLDPNLQHIIPVNSGSVTGAGNNVGGLVGRNTGSIITLDPNIPVNSGSVTSAGDNIGGLVGSNTGEITASSNSGSVTGAGDYVGGIAGLNAGVSGTNGVWVNPVITDCYNSGSVTSVGDNVGGIAGLNNGAISASYNAADVSGKDKVGGVAGSSLMDKTKSGTPTVDEGRIEYCYNEAGVSVSGTDYVGGVVGDMQDGAIFASYNKADVTGSDHVGGVAGNMEDGTIIACYNNAVVNGAADVGGVVGTVGDGTITAVYNTGAVSGTKDYVGGLIGSLWGAVRNSYNTGKVNGGSSSVPVPVPVRGGLAGDAGSTGFNHSTWADDTSDFAFGDPTWMTSIDSFSSANGFIPEESWTTGDGTDRNYWKVGTVAGMDGVSDTTTPYPLPRLWYEE
ncbi:hypothetical protein FACS1894163_09610 [Spirochaetia bacterium]|nr:hypothetical protein FACS1894163_09610 [Spirochaetia bacterium]